MSFAVGAPESSRIGSTLNSQIRAKSRDHVHLTAAAIIYLSVQLHVHGQLEGVSVGPLLDLRGSRVSVDRLGVSSLSSHAIDYYKASKCICYLRQKVDNPNLYFLYSLVSSTGHSPRPESIGRSILDPRVDMAGNTKEVGEKVLDYLFTVTSYCTV